MTNQKVRQAAKAADVKLWEIAERLGITDSTFSRKLRREFTTDEQARVLEIIAILGKEKCK